MSDRFGTKLIFIISLILFTIGSILCAFATTADQLIFFRILQGLGGGMVTPIAFASLSYGLSEGGTSWTSSKPIFGLAVGVISLILFTIVELTRKKEPLL